MTGWLPQNGALVREFAPKCPTNSGLGIIVVGKLNEQNAGDFRNFLGKPMDFFVVGAGGDVFVPLECLMGCVSSQCFFVGYHFIYPP